MYQNSHSPSLREGLEGHHICWWLHHPSYTINRNQIKNHCSVAKSYIALAHNEMLAATTVIYNYVQQIFSNFIPDCITLPGMGI